MSIHTQTTRIGIPQIMGYKGQRKIAALTAYTAPFARLLDDCLDLILVGDSTAMVGYGLPSTLSITAAQMAAHAAAVVRVTGHAFILVDMPLGRRSEARRVGKERVSKCRSRWSPRHEKKKPKT